MEYSDLRMMLEKIKKNLVTILVGIAAILTIIEQLWKGRWGIKMIFDLFPAKIETFWLLMTIFAMIILLVNYDKIFRRGRKYEEYEKETKQSKSKLEEKKEKAGQYDELVKTIESRLEKKIQLQHNLEYKAQHNRGEEPKITVWQKFSNASDFEFKIKRIDTIAKLTGGPEIERFRYDESDNIFFDKQKLFFPEKIAPLDLFNNEIKYRINDITKLARAFPYYKRRAFLIEIEQAIEFATQATTTPRTVKKTEKNTVNIQPEDWKGGRR